VKMSPRVRRVALTAHVAASVGWLGAVGAFLALSVVGLVDGDASTVRAVYLAMEATGWFVLVPLSVASLLTGLVQSLGTPWGLFLHYWVVFKLLINLLATVVLLLYMETLSSLSSIAADSNGSDMSALRDPSPALHAGAAVLMLLIATVLGMYKPRGLTRYGRRNRDVLKTASRRT
jgi:hypothetical protein